MDIIHVTKTIRFSRSKANILLRGGIITRTDIAGVSNEVTLESVSFSKARRILNYASMEVKVGDEWKTVISGSENYLRSLYEADAIDTEDGKLVKPAMPVEDEPEVVEEPVAEEAVAETVEDSTVKEEPAPVEEEVAEVSDEVSVAEDSIIEDESVEEAVAESEVADETEIDATQAEAPYTLTEEVATSEEETVEESSDDEDEDGTTSSDLVIPIAQAVESAPVATNERVYTPHPSKKHHKH